jgi:hypothetical protein
LRTEPRIGIATQSAQFVYAVLGADHDSSPYTQTGERIARIAAGGIRLVIDELRTDVTKTRKDGTRGRLRIDYADHRAPQAALQWLWKFVDGAKTAGELYGRALMVIAAEQHASRLVVPSSQRMPATRWSSHKAIAGKALKKLAGSHVPTSLTELEQAVKCAHAAYDKAEARFASCSAPSGSPSPRWTTGSATSSTRTSTTPRSRSRADTATRWWHALTGVRVAGDRPASAAGPRPRKEPTMAAASSRSR